MKSRPEGRTQHHKPGDLVGFQEIGGGEDLAVLAQAVSARYRRPHEALFVRGRNQKTGQNTGAILDASRGVGHLRQASADCGPKGKMLKCLVVRLTKAVASLDVSEVPLRRPMSEDGKAR